MKRLLIAGVALLLAGCAESPGAWQSYKADVSCRPGRECQVMMSNAYNYIRENTGASITKSNSSTIEAKKHYMEDDHMHYYVHKSSVSSSYDSIRVEVSCNSGFCHAHPKDLCNDIVAAIRK